MVVGEDCLICFECKDANGTSECPFRLDQDTDFFWPCQHAMHFHEGCIREWINHQQKIVAPSCPVCTLPFRLVRCGEEVDRLSGVDDGYRARTLVWQGTPEDSEDSEGEEGEEGDGRVVGGAGYWVRDESRVDNVNVNAHRDDCGECCNAVFPCCFCTGLLMCYCM
ncbi:MAG: hypothetical protein CL916_03220 [Deltaproteobacteria bacterium]|nr:hypothetical protein [Deltaproteobacteria bacterium]